jgi:hypothetical protein
MLFAEDKAHRIATFEITATNPPVQVLKWLVESALPKARFDSMEKLTDLIGELQKNGERNRISIKAFHLRRY